MMRCTIRIPMGNYTDAYIRDTTGVLMLNSQIIV